MAFLDFLKRQNITGGLDRAREFAGRNLPAIAGIGAGLISAPVGLGPVGAFAGYGAGKVLQEQFAPQYAKPKTQIGEPYETLGKASLLGTGFGLLQPAFTAASQARQAPQPQQPRPVGPVQAARPPEAGADVRPWHQIALEEASAKKDFKAMGQILDRIPANDPYKRTMEQIFRPQAQAAQKPIFQDKAFFDMVMVEGKKPGASVQGVLDSLGVAKSEFLNYIAKLQASGVIGDTEVRAALPSFKEVHGEAIRGASPSEEEADYLDWKQSPLSLRKAVHPRTLSAPISALQMGGVGLGTLLDNLSANKNLRGVEALRGMRR